MAEIRPHPTVVVPSLKKGKQSLKKKEKKNYGQEAAHSHNEKPSPSGDTISSI